MGSVHNSSVEQLKAINEIVNSITTISTSSDNIKKQYINVASKLGDIKNNINSGDIYYIDKSTDTKNIKILINSIIYKDLDIISLSKMLSEERD